MKDFSSRPLCSFSVLQCYFTLPVRLQSFFYAWRFIYTAATKFFIFQFLRKIHILNIKIKHVDHEYDNLIPFKTEVLDTYLDFVNFWLRPISMLQQKFGIRKGTKTANKFLKYITLTYKEAYNLYKKCMSTTYQPETNDKQLKTMRFFDPHYLCVPSLHIAIIVLTCSFYERFLNQDIFSEQEKLQWTKELREHGMEIADSVLYLKQHSVNCIPAALYMMTRITPELLTPTCAITFIDQFLKQSDCISSEDKVKITSYIEFMYERFLLEGSMEDDWRIPVLRWLETYEHCKPSFVTD